jgi:AcrR family transcriptional regulator
VPDRRERKKAATRRLLAETAFNLACERGLAGFSLNELAEEADVSRRTVSNYFDSKEQAVAFVTLLTMREALSDLSVESDVPLPDQIDNLLRTQFSEYVITTHRRLVELASESPSLQPYVHDVEQRGVAEAAQFLRARLGPDYPPMYAYLVVGAAYGAMSALLDGRLVLRDAGSITDPFNEVSLDGFISTIADYLRHGFHLPS